MASFVVMESPVDRAPRDPLFVRDGFSWIGFLLPLVWLLWHRLWIEAVLTFAVLFVLGAVAESAGLGAAAPLVSLIAGLYIGIDGAAIRLAALERRGWREWGVIEARDATDAEIRHAVATGDASEPDFAPREILPDPREARPAAAHSALGLIGYSGGR